uniref:DUF223 domain-containing protein n=1 Tax=Haemonchus contortus TaxID=6289 RepID=A0A7I4YQD9_HAECO
MLALIYTIFSSLVNRGDPSNMFEKNNRCLQSRTDGMHVEELWSKIPMIVNQCSERRYLRIRGYSNRDEIKVHVMPSKEVEVSMKEDMPNCSFFGADPVKEPNQDMFETVGVFYHIAVGGKNGTSLATVLEPDTRSYRIREVNHVDIATFLGRFIRKQINVEIHHPDYEQKVLFFEFFLELLDDRRYIPLVADTMVGHIRLYLLNYEHQECRRRYVSP